MGPTLGPTVDRYARRREQGQKLAGSITGFFNKLEDIEDEKLEKEYLKSKGHDLTALKGKGYKRAAALAYEGLLQDQKYNAKLKAGRRPDINSGQSFGKESVSEPGEYKKNAPSFLNMNAKSDENQPFEEVPKKTGLIPQRTVPNELRPVPSVEEVEQLGVAIARENNLPDQEGIDIALQKRQDLINQNNMVRSEDQAIAQKKSELNAIGQTRAMNSIQTADPEVFTHFGKEAEKLGEVVDSPAELDNAIEKNIREYKTNVARVSRSIPSPRGEKKDKSNIKNLLKPLAAFPNVQREILSEKGYDLEEREDLVSGLSEYSNKVIAQMPSINKKGRVTPTGMGSASLASSFNEMSNRTYTPQEKELIDQTVDDIFSSDPSSNIVLVRKALESKGVNWRAYKDALDKAVDEGKLKMTDEQFDHYSQMNEPPISFLGHISRFFRTRGL